MKVIRCDVCKSVVSVSDSATITIHPNNFSERFEVPNKKSNTYIVNESFDLCKHCLVKTLRTYYGEQFGKGDVES